VVPLQVRRRLDVARRHFDDFGACLYAEVVDRELGDGRRVVAAAHRVVAFQPFAAAAPFKTWIMPRFHQPSFGQAADELLDELARVLRSVLHGLRVALEDPPYNLVIHSAPPGDEGRQYCIWHLQIVPRLATPAGFELGTGIPINPSLPEDTAATLRASLEGPSGG
jgi:UDPglucose--hexose-1-phosphate uridylyltransferase